MTISWPLAIIIIVAIGGAAVFLTVVSTGGTKHERELSGAQQAADLDKLLEQYRTLAQETKTAQETIRSNLADVLAKVDAIERMLREVG